MQLYVICNSFLFLFLICYSDDFGGINFSTCNDISLLGSWWGRLIGDPKFHVNHLFLFLKILELEYLLFHIPVVNYLNYKRLNISMLSSGVAGQSWHMVCCLENTLFQHRRYSSCCHVNLFLSLFFSLLPCCFTFCLISSPERCCCQCCSCNGHSKISAEPFFLSNAEFCSSRFLSCTHCYWMLDKLFPDLDVLSQSLTLTLDVEGALIYAIKLICSCFFFVTYSQMHASVCHLLHVMPSSIAWLFTMHSKDFNYFLEKLFCHLLFLHLFWFFNCIFSCTHPVSLFMYFFFYGRYFDIFVFLFIAFGPPEYSETGRNTSSYV